MEQDPIRSLPARATARIEPAAAVPDRSTARTPEGSVVTGSGHRCRGDPILTVVGVADGPWPPQFLLTKHVVGLMDVYGQSWSAWAEVSHATTRRDKASRIADSHKWPSPVAIMVRSATHSRTGESAVKSRWTRSGTKVALTLQDGVHARRAIGPPESAWIRWIFSVSSASGVELGVLLVQGREFLALAGSQPVVAFAGFGLTDEGP